MKKLKFLSKEIAEELIDVIDDYLNCNYELTGNDILEGKVVTKNTRYECQKCNLNRARYRILTEDYKCESCKEVFK